MFQRVSRRALLAAGKVIAIVAPHPDDELFGCGLLIAAAKRAGVQVVVIVLTDGQASHPGSVRWPAARLARLRRGETRRGLGRLGGGNIALRFMGWQDGALGTSGRAMRLRAALAASGATAVLVTSPHDFHPDHRAAFALVARATRGRTVQLLTYDVWSRVTTPAPPARDSGVGRKRWAAAAHRSQLGGYIVDDPAAFEFDPPALAMLVGGEERYARVVAAHAIIRRGC